MVDEDAVTAVVLLSGGLDSTVTLAKAMDDGRKAVALSFRYGQRHTRELDSARDVCVHYGIEHIVMDIDLRVFRSSLTRPDMDIPDRDTGIGGDIPDTYVPARNMLFLSVAAGLCESRGADAIYIGANAVDYSGYPDCRPEFFERFREMAAAGTKAGAEGHPLKIETPILYMSKGDIVRLGMKLNAPLEMTWSCYAGGRKACGRCDSCRLRLKGFSDAGVKDPLEYE
jgi:7-cyano-7-deazaguanine synthase